MPKSSKLLAEKFGDLLKNRGLYCTVAESCTGGGLGAVITSIAGSSMWFDRGFVTYSNKAKQEMLDVRAEVLLSDGAVSEATVCQMVNGALQHSMSQVAIAITGVAGPSGGGQNKPVGTVWIAVAIQTAVQAVMYSFTGDRDAIREQSIVAALELAIKILSST